MNNESNKRQRTLELEPGGAGGGGGGGGGAACGELQLILPRLNPAELVEEVVDIDETVNKRTTAFEEKMDRIKNQLINPTSLPQENNIHVMNETNTVTITIPKNNKMVIYQSFRNLRNLALNSALVNPTTKDRITNALKSTGLLVGAMTVEHFCQTYFSRSLALDVLPNLIVQLFDSCTSNAGSTIYNLLAKPVDTLLFGVAILSAYDITLPAIGNSLSLTVEPTIEEALDIEILKNLTSKLIPGGEIETNLVLRELPELPDNTTITSGNSDNESIQSFKTALSHKTTVSRTELIAALLALNDVPVPMHIEGVDDVVPIDEGITPGNSQEDGLVGGKKSRKTAKRRKNAKRASKKNNKKSRRGKKSNKKR